MPNPNVEALAKLLAEQQLGEAGAEVWSAYMPEAEFLASRGVLVISDAVLTDEVAATLPEVRRLNNNPKAQRAEADVLRGRLAQLAKGETP